MAGTGNQQIIAGKPQTQYTPEWYDAMDANQIHNAGVAGTAQGTGAGNEATTFLKALQTTGLPLLGSSSGAGGGYSGAAGGAGGGVPSHVGAPGLSGLQTAVGGGGGAVPGVGPIDTSGAQRAAFARAKDQVGQEATSGLAGLRSAMGGRGMLGSGAEGKLAANVVGKGLGQLGDVSREQAIQRSALAERTATTNYQGGIAQRGQDLSNNQAINALNAGMAKTGFEGAIQQRGQDISSQQAAADRAMAQAHFQQVQQQTALQGLLSALGGSGRKY